MENLSFIVGVIGNIISILFFLSPVNTFWKIVKKKSTGNYKGLPYICTLLSTSLWTFYGLLTPNGLLIATVNGAGAVFQTIYVSLFLIFAPRDIKVKYLKLVAIFNIGSLAVVITITLLVIHGGLRLTVIGVICAGLTLGMYASPLAAMKTVIKMQSVEYMPFSLSFFLFLNASIWSVYAVLVKDFYVGVPNAIGFVLGSAQLILYVIYNRRSTKSIEMMEEDSAHLVKDAGEMGEYKENMSKKERNLLKGRSLPKTAVSRQHSFQGILKTLSLGPHELHSTYSLEEDVENGDSSTHQG